MKQCKMDCIHIEACRRFADNNTYWNSGDCPVYKPSADVVEVVRCNDCKHCEVIYPFKHLGMEAVERLYCKSDHKSRMATDFCSYGERKE